MIQIYPKIDFIKQSPYGSRTLVPNKILWQGIHTSVEVLCEETNQKLVADLPVGHAVAFPCIVNVLTEEIICAPEVKKWLGVPFLHSLIHPNNERVSFTVEKIREYSTVVILNCIDNYYGHSLLKLFNAERHLDKDNDCGLIVLIQEQFRWLVPDGVAEIWTVDIPLSRAHHYYPSLDEQIHNECRRFKSIFTSKAYSHPAIRDIVRFSGTERHDHRKNDYRITFIWRSDRPWIDNIYLIEALKRLELIEPLLQFQNKKIQKLFMKLKKKIPNARFTVVGLGTQTSFPSWIEDLRVNSYSTDTEKAMCKIYSESRVTIGVHGSNMLLPSAHAGMTVDLMPTDRWSNIAQDIVFQEPDTRLSSFRYRFFPISTSVTVLAQVIASQVEEFDFFKQHMLH